MLSQRAQASLPRIQELNPLATVACHACGIGSLSDEQLQAFTLIVATTLPRAETVREGLTITARVFTDW